MDKCKECYFESGGVCDMCDYGGNEIINNHGRKIAEVKECMVELKKEDDPIRKEPTDLELRSQMRGIKRELDRRKRDTSAISVKKIKGRG